MNIGIADIRNNLAECLNRVAYQVVYRIEDDKLIVLVMRVGHRRDIYGRGK